MLEIAPYFKKVGALTIIFIWIFLITPFYTALSILISFPEYNQEIIFSDFIFITVSVSLIILYINKNIKKF